MGKKARIVLRPTIFVLFLLLGAFMVVVPDSTLAAQEGDYIYTESGGVATITGYLGTGGDIIIPSTLGGYAVVAIGDSAFIEYTYHNLTSIVIPDSVISIGNNAFESCTSLTSMTIPNSVTSIWNYSFSGCSSLTSVTIPSSVTSIGGSAFANCISLTSVIIPTSVKSIGEYVFAFCTSLTSVTIPNSVTSISPYAFDSCTSLTSVTIPNSVTSIGDYAFITCTSLTSVIIPNSVTSIGEYVFAHCSSLTSVTIPNSVTHIGGLAFYSCTSLTSISFLGLVAPTTVGGSWIENIDGGIRGHAYAASNFPAPGGVFHGLTMGAVIPVVPSAPTNLSASPGNASVTLTWTAPVSDGGSPIAGYKLYQSTTSGGTYSLIASPSALTYTDTGLTNGQTYWYKVSAVNAIGVGANCSAVSALVPQPASPAGDITILILVAVVAIVLVFLAVLLFMRKKK